MTDDRPRCPWGTGDPLNLAYHDTEWGVPIHDDRRLFELLSLEGAQAGLAWITILRKRDGYRRAFEGWDPQRIAGYGPEDEARLLADAGIVRNRAKVESVIGNAQGLPAHWPMRRATSTATCGRSSRSARSRTDGPRVERGVPAETDRLPRAVARPEEARLLVRRADHRVRLHAVGRAGQRPPGQLLPPRGAVRAA